VRADYLDDVVWTHVTALLAELALVQAELDRRLTDMRATNPATSERARLERDVTRTTKAIQRLVQSHQEDLLTLDELRACMPDLRAKQTTLQASVDTLDAQLFDQETYLKLAQTLEDFLARLRETTDTATVNDRQKSATQRSQRGSRGLPLTYRVNPTPTLRSASPLQGAEP
jgi:site-specific DNA recombinase